MTTTREAHDVIAEALIGDDRNRYTYLNDAQYHAQVELLALHLPDDAADEGARSTLAGIGQALAESAERRMYDRLQELDRIVHLGMNRAS